MTSEGGDESTTEPAENRKRRWQEDGRRWRLPAITTAVLLAVVFTLMMVFRGQTDAHTRLPTSAPISEADTSLTEASHDGLAGGVGAPVYSGGGIGSNGSYTAPPSNTGTLESSSSSDPQSSSFSSSSSAAATAAASPSPDTAQPSSPLPPSSPPQTTPPLQPPPTAPATGRSQEPTDTNAGGDAEEQLLTDGEVLDTTPTISTLISVLAESLGAGDPLLAAIRSGRNISEGTDDMCVAASAAELQKAVDERPCPTVLLTKASDDAYVLSEQIWVNRSVTIQGHPALMPTIDCSNAVRCFRVHRGAHLELKYLRTTQGEGTIRKRPVVNTRRRAQAGGEAAEENNVAQQEQNEEGPTTGEVIEVRGGAVLLDADAKGATFVGVIFLAVAASLRSVQVGIQATLLGIGGRVYGGHVFIAAGAARFYDCVFWDVAAFLPLTDQLVVGGDILMLGDELVMSGCRWFLVGLIGQILTMGASVSVFGGTAVFTWTHMTSVGLYNGVFGAGSTLLVAGGVMVITGMVYHSFTAVANLAGIGTFTTGAGVLIITGLALDTFIGVENSLGAGFLHAVGAGVMVQTGTALAQVTGPSHQERIGANFYVGSGVAINIGVSSYTVNAVVTQNGQAGLTYCGTGLLMHIACPLVAIAGVNMFQGLGGLVALMAGHMIYLYNPAFVVNPINYFAGLGGVGFVGGGSAIIGYSPYYQVAPITYDTAQGGLDADWYVTGNINATGFGSPVYVSADETVALGDGDLNSNPSTNGTNASNGATVGDSKGGGGTKGDYEGVAARSGVTIRAWNMQAYRQLNLGNQTLKATLRNFVQPDVLKAAERWQRKLRRSTRRHHLSRYRSTTQRPTMWIDSEADVADCRYCSMGHVEGPGAQTCTRADTCGDTKQHPAFSVDDVEFQAQHIIMCHIRLTVAPGARGDTSVRAIALRDAIRAWLKDQGHSDVHVSAYSAAEVVPSVLMDHLRSAPSPTHATTFHYHAALVTNNSAAGGALTTLFREASGEDFRGFTFTVTSHVREHTGVTVSIMDAALERTLVVPAYNSHDFKTKAFVDQPRGSNSVHVVKTGEEGVAVATLIAGETYAVRLDSFHPNTVLAVQLIGSRQVKGLSGQIHLVQTATLVKILTLVNDSGSASFDWQLPALTEPGGYYLRATDATGQVFGTSTLLAVTRDTGNGPW